MLFVDVCIPSVLDIGEWYATGCCRHELHGFRMIKKILVVG